MERLWKPCRFILQSAALFITLLMILVVLLMPDVGHRTWLRLQEALTNHDTPGFQKRWYFDENGDAHAYSLFVPHNLTPTDRPPVILFLNGLGEDGTDGVMPLTNGLGRAVWEIQRVFPFVCVFPQRHPNEDWDPGGTAIQRSLGILRQTEGEFHTDPDRVYLTGISTGAIAAWSLAAAHPDRFAALFPVSGTYSPSETERIADAGIPVWISYNAEDSPALVNANRSVHTHLLLRGLSPCFTEIGGTAICQRDSHDAWSFAYRNGALYSWLLRQKKANRSIGNKRFHPVRPHRVLSESGDTSVIVPGIVDTDFELHAEFRPVDNFTCGFAVVCPPQQATSDISVRFTITSPEAGSGFVRVSGPEQPATVHCSDIAQGSIGCLE